MDKPSYSPQISPFMTRITETLRLKRSSLATEKAYCYILDYIRFHAKQHPEQLGPEEVRSYLSYLAVDRKVAASTQNLAFATLLFL